MLRSLAPILCIPFLLVNPVSAQDAPAPTASGLPSENREDLSAQTSQSGSPNQPDLNVLSGLRGTELKGGDGASVGRVADIALDGTGQIKGLIIGTGGIAGLGETRRFLGGEALPAQQDGAPVVQMSPEEVASLPEYVDQPGSWLAGNLLGLSVKAERNEAVISDIRFTQQRVDRVVLQMGGLLAKQSVELPFESLVLAGEPSKPDVQLTEDGRKRLDAIVEIR